MAVIYAPQSTLPPLPNLSEFHLREEEGELVSDQRGGSMKIREKERIGI